MTLQPRRRLQARTPLLAAALLAFALPRPAAAGDAPDATQTIAGTTCRLIESAARSSGLPVGLLTRLVWAESRFKATAISGAGAQGIAQFMPGTASERGLADPFDPEQAIPAAARLLVDLDRQFGNLGLASAAYNAGSARVGIWLAGGAPLPRETQAYVLSLTGRSAEDWAAAGHEPAPSGGESCLAVTRELETEPDSTTAPLAPWGVQLAGNFSKRVALASFERARSRYAALLGGIRPMVIGARLRSRGTLPFYRVLVPAASRAEADRLCRSIMAGGGACAALRT